MTSAVSRTVNRLVDQVEHASALDKTAGAVADFLQKVLPGGPAQDLLSGTPVGHPAHPLAATVPIGAWTAASVLDLTGADAKAARRLVGFGILSAVPTALSGANDWVSTHGAERRVGLVHAALNYAALATYTASWLARRRGRRVKGAALALGGFAGLGVSGWLGGHLAHGIGVGVDTTAFTHLPTDWTDVGADAEIGAGTLHRVEAGGVPVLLCRVDGRLTAMFDRCTHRGGPLHEGRIDNGCVVCPWHASAFDLTDGAVASGPASRPQPTAEVRVLEGRVQIRRPDEPRSLRADSVGV